MKCFEVKRGIRGTVYFPRPSKERRNNWAVREDLVFAQEEMIFDPITLHNGGLEKASQWCKSQARQGKAGFRRDGYLLVVDYNDVNVM